MQKKLIYDLSTRLFHWVFAALFVFAFFVAKTVDDENPVFSYHMLAGLLLGGLVALRLIWGLLGTKYARFSSFALKPKELILYIKGIFSGSKKRWAGHNPASSWAALVMMGSALMLALSGILMTSGYKESFEDIHELFANAFLVTVLLHIAGVALHALRHRDGIALTMIHGKKAQDEGQFEISGHKPMSAILLIVLMGAYGAYLANNYNSTSKQLNFFGKSLTLGENEKGEKGVENDDDDD
jgi:cytochrome b